MQSIEPGNPVLLADEDKRDGKLRVILFRSDYHIGHYGIVIADIIGHAAKALACEKQELVDAIMREVNHPTDTLKQIHHVSQ